MVNSDPGGAVVDFLADHRFMNWVVYAALRAAKNNGHNFTVLDIGCYDGLLVNLLNNKGIPAFGFEKHDWNEMYTLLGIRDKVGLSFDRKMDVAIMLNYVHEFRPDELFPFLEEKCNGLPKYAFFDREAANPHKNMRYYFDKDVLKHCDITVVTLPECSRVSKETERDLLVWKNPVE